MSGWRFLHYRLNGDGTETLLHPDVHLVDSHVTDVLSAPALLTGSIPDSTHVTVEPYSSAIYAELDGTIRAGTIVTETEEGDGVTQFVSLGFLGYLNGQGWTDEPQLFYDTDPAMAYRWVWWKVQQNVGADLGLTFGPLSTPVRVGRRADVADETTSDEPLLFATYATTDVGKALADLADEGNIELREVHTWDGETIRHTVEMAYPRRGRRHGSRWVIGENITQVPTLRGDAAVYASDVTVVGAGDGPAALTGRARAATLGRLRRAVTISRTDLATKDAAEAYAVKALAKRQPITAGFETLTVRDSPYAQVGEVLPGDDVNVTGWGQDSWVRVISVDQSPGAVEVTWRVQPVGGA